MRERGRNIERENEGEYRERGRARQRKIKKDQVKDREYMEIAEESKRDREGER